MVPFSVEWLDRLGFDDPSGSISVHAVGGLWGVLAAGLFVQARPGQWMAQVAMISALLGFVLPLTYGLNCCSTASIRSASARTGAPGPGYVRTRRRRLSGSCPSLKRLSLSLGSCNESCASEEERNRAQVD